MQRIGVLRRGLEDRAIDLLRSRPLLCLLQRECDSDPLVERQCAIVAGALLHQRASGDGRGPAYAPFWALRSYLK